MPQFLIPALISGGAGLIGSGMQASAASSAAKTQADAANRASQNQMDMFQQIQKNLAPYMGVGTNGIGAFNNQMFGGGALGQAPNMTTGSGDVWSGAPTTGSGDIFNGSPSLITGGALPSVYQPWGTGADAQATLEQTPGYQFTLNQGLKSLGNSFASRGLGASGAALKGASQYTTGLADNTYNQQLQNNMAQQGQQYGQGLSNQTTAFNQGLQGYGQYFSQLLGANQQKLAGQNQLFGQGLAGNAQALAGSTAAVRPGRHLRGHALQPPDGRAWHRPKRGERHGHLRNPGDLGLQRLSHRRRLGAGGRPGRRGERHRRRPRKRGQLDLPSLPAEPAVPGGQ
jgi:hypothetical protein